MCTRFVFRGGGDVVIGFNFDIDLAVWEHTVLADEERFCIGIKMPDGLYHTYHGVNASGGAGTLLYVHPNEKASEFGAPGSVAISELTERYVRGECTFPEALETVRQKRIVYAPDASMQSMLSDRNGRALMIEPGVGSRLEEGRYALVTNYSLLDPASTRPYIVPGDDRYERAKEILDRADERFGVEDALRLLREVRQEGLWATRVSFVYSARENGVYYALNNDFSHIRENRFKNM